MVKQNRTSRLIREGKPAIGVWMTLCDPGIAVIFAHLGYDWVFVDTEHNFFSDLQLQFIARVLNQSNTAPFFRVRFNDAACIKMALDMGAFGVIVPLIETPDDARRAVSYAKYPPIGARGYGPLRASDFWYCKEDYDRLAFSEEIMLVIQIECARAIEHIDEILHVPGIDGIFIGPSDLSTSMGHHDDPTHPEVQQAFTTVVEAANRVNMPWGTPIGDEESLRTRLGQGAQLVTYGCDNRFIKAGAAENLAVARRATSAQSR